MKAPTFKEKACVECGAVFVPTGPCAKYCGDECRRTIRSSREARPENKKRKTEYMKKYLANPKIKKRRAEYISEYNSRSENRKRKAEWEAVPKNKKRRAEQEVTPRRKKKRLEYQNRPEIKKKSAEKSAKRRALKKGAAYEKIDFDEIFQRGGGKCGICGNKIDPTLKSSHPMSCQMDHIIPLSKGGGTTYTNMQPTHARCNRSKNNRTVEHGEQLKLV